MKYIVAVYEEIEGRKPTPAESIMLRSGLEAVHERLEVEGVL